MVAAKQQVTAPPLTSVWLAEDFGMPSPPDGSTLYSDEPEMESSLHFAQIALIVACLEWLWRDRQDFFIGANLTVYYSAQQTKSRDFRGPDFFLVNGVERKHRLSWVVWEEGGRYPDLVIEILSASTETVDRTSKKQLYQNIWRLPEYFWFSPDTLELVGFRLGKKRYQKITPNAAGLLWSDALGMFLGISDRQLRLFDAQGQLLPTPAEAAEKSQQEADRLREKLRALGVDPDA